MGRYRIRTKPEPQVGKEDLLYEVFENDLGELRYDYRGRLWGEGNDPNALALPRRGHMAHGPVTDVDAEIITGLFMPAAMDRLRELVHEAPNE